MLTCGPIANRPLEFGGLVAVGKEILTGNVKPPAAAQELISALNRLGGSEGTRAREKTTEKTTEKK